MEPALRSLAETVLDEAPCVAVLPAGCGKTELVAASAKVASDQHKRLLVLTHTNAGVDALRRRLRRFEVPERDSRISTADGWALELARAFRTLTGWSDIDGLPDWAVTREACRNLLTNRHVLDMVRRTYDYLVVDEYQDCSSVQHGIVMAIAAEVPVVILGDPLQAIYGFRDTILVDWETDLNHLPLLSLDVHPWRWAKTNPALGEFLFDARDRLEAGQSIDLSGSPIQWVPAADESRRQLCYAHIKRPGTTVLLYEFEPQCEKVARQLNGAYGVMEDLDGSILLRTAAELQRGGTVFAGAVMKLAFRSHARLPAALKTKGAAMEEGTFPSYRTGSSMTTTLDTFRHLAEAPDGATLACALDAISALPDGVRFRHEAWTDFRSAARLWDERGPDASLVDAVRTVRDRARIMGRRAEQRVVSRPLLVKGLEYDHACVLNADPLGTRQLYVALTRGRRSVAVVSQSPKLSPVL